MDPITAVGLASSVLTFVEFSFKVVSGTYEVIRSGSTAENAQVGAVLAELRLATEGLRKSPKGYSKHDDALSRLASECQEISEELESLLLKLKTEVGSSKWKSMNVTLRSMRKKGDVAHLETRLEKCRSQMMLRLMLLLNERQTSIHVQLHNMQAQSQSQLQKSDVVKELADLRDNVLKKIEDGMQRGNEVDSTESDQLQILIKDVRNSVRSLLDASAGPSPEARILKQLYFDSIYSREDTIESAATDTFDWILKDAPGPESEVPDEEPDPYATLTIDQKLEALEKDTMKIRQEARNNFLNWLRTENGVFHISGKAGSGKSTLMKLFLTNPQLQVHLRHWAGERQLVFGHFFFWKAGDMKQRSLEGLQRSILFETLKNCPDLIQDVFAEAYESFSRSSVGSSIDDLYFRPRDLESAMNRLMSASHNSEYRMCLFIDGLDEYGEDGSDELHHEDLAEQLRYWAYHDGIKVLVSSRPYRVFQEAFMDNRRIKLHELTKPDISHFALNMFENDKNFTKVKSCYKDLVYHVAEHCNGVFLWARLVTRSLIMATRRSCDPDYLWKQLRQKPQDISELYEQLLASIDKSDREIGFRMLLLVAMMGEIYATASVFSLALLDHLDNSDFPTSCESRLLYSDDEIESLEATVEARLDDYTKGLLEIRPSVDLSEPFRGVQFFHRTVLDFVKESKALSAFLEQHPESSGVQARGRMLLAELWFTNMGYNDRLDRTIPIHFNELPDDECRETQLNELEKGFLRRKANGSVSLSHLMIRALTWLSSHSQYPTNESSFIHWVASQLDDPGYIRRKLAENPGLLTRNDLQLSLVVSASLSHTRPKPATLKALFDLGLSPNEQIEVGWPQSSSVITAWMLLCACFANLVISEDAAFHNRLFPVLKEFLATGAVDTNCLILIRPGTLYRFEPARGQLQNRPAPRPTHCISLRELIQQSNIPDKHCLLNLIDSSNRGIWSTVRRAWSFARPPQYDLASLQSTYDPYDVSLSLNTTKSNVNGASFNHDDESASGYNALLVDSVVWENALVEPSVLNFRLY